MLLQLNCFTVANFHWFPTKISCWETFLGPYFWTFRQYIHRFDFISIYCCVSGSESPPRSAIAGPLHQCSWLNSSVVRWLWSFLRLAEHGPCQQSRSLPGTSSMRVSLKSLLKIMTKISQDNTLQNFNLLRAQSSERVWHLQPFPESFMTHPNSALTSSTLLVEL